MRHLRIIHHLRTITFLLVLMIILGAIGTLLWANYTGMPKSWRQAVERAIAVHGIHVEIGALSYNPLQGITVREVKLYASAERQQVISKLEGIIIHLDNAKLAKGEIQLARVKLSKARLVLPVDPSDPNSELLEIDNIQGEFIPPGNPHIELRNVHGTIAGIEVILNAKIADDLADKPPVSRPSTQGEKRKLLSKIVKELRQWSFDKKDIPQIRIQYVGKRSQMDQARATIAFHGNSIEKNQHTIDELMGEAELYSNLLTVHSLHARNGSRHLNARIEYELDEQVGRFNLRSTLEVPDLLESWLGMKPLNDVVITGEQNLEASGEFKLQAGKKPDFHATGHARCESALLKDIRFDEVESDFACRNNDIFFKDLVMIRQDGKVTGKALIENDLVRMDLHSTLLPEYYRPLFLGKPTEILINNFKTNPKSKLDLRLEGGFNRKDLRSWAYAGKATLHDISYRGVDLAAAETDLSVSSSQMDFTNGSVTFDYTNYPMAKRFGGVDQGKLTCDSVRYRLGEKKQVSFAGLSGSVWPAPVCRLFIEKTANHLESYGFHQPPQISASGTIGLQDKKDTLISIDFKSEHQAEYNLLNAPVVMSNPRGKVTITDKLVAIDDLQLSAFEGPITAKMRFPKEQAMSIDIEASKLSMNSINSTYGMKMECGGELTGAINFKMMPRQLATMQGSGNFKLEKAELFSVPIFGPLSHVMQKVLGDKRIGSERARDATCTFVVQEGVMASNDFRTSTTSLVFAGDGWVDLNKKTIDMTMRMNGRGLLGILTIPLRPFYGLFQFRGTGPLQKPIWENVAFTKPNEKVAEMLLKTPLPQNEQP